MMEIAKGNTVNILRTLYNGAIAVEKSLHESTMIPLIKDTASSYITMPMTDVIVTLRDNIDHILPDIPADKKKEAADHIKTNASLSTNIDDLVDARTRLLAQYKTLKTAYQKIRDTLNEGKPFTAADKAAIEADTQKFVDAVKQYSAKHSNLLGSFQKLHSDVVRCIPVEQRPSIDYTTPTATM